MNRNNLILHSTIYLLCSTAFKEGFLTCIQTFNLQLIKQKVPYYLIPAYRQMKCGTCLAIDNLLKRNTVL